MKKKILYLLLFVSASCLSQNVALQPFGKNVSKKDSAKIEQIFRYQAEFYGQFAPAVDSLLPKIIIFKNPEGLHNYLNFIDKKPAWGHNTVGTFVSKRRELLVAHTENNDILQKISWQISNYFIFLTLKNIHSGKDGEDWIQIGLNGYFKNISLTKKGIKHNPPLANTKARIKTAIETNELNLKEFVGFTKKQLYKSQTTNNSYAYSLAYGIVYFLTQKDFNQFKKIVLQIKNGSSSYDAINTTYQGGFSRFETDFIAYYSKWKH